jgi:hypothetical protein
LRHGSVKLAWRIGNLLRGGSVLLVWVIGIRQSRLLAVRTPAGPGSKCACLQDVLRPLDTPLARPGNPRAAVRAGSLVWEIGIACVGDRYCLCGRSVFARFSAFTAWRFLPSGGPYLCGDRYRYRPAREPLGAAYCVVRGAHHPFFAGGCYHARGPGSWIRRTGPSSLPLSGSRP